MAYRYLLAALLYGGWLRLRIPYFRTRFGRSWLSLSSLISLVILGGVYGQITRVQDWRSYAVYLALGLICWNLLAGTIGSSSELLQRIRSQLLNQELPVGFYVLENWITQVLVFLQSSLAVAGLIVLAQPQLILHGLFGGWLGILNLWLGALWLSLLVAPIALRLPDLVPLIPLGLQLAFLGSPILYFSSSLGRFSWLVQFNPLYLWVKLARDPWLGLMRWDLQLSVFTVQILLVILLIPWLDRQRLQLVESL